MRRAAGVLAVVAAVLIVLTAGVFVHAVATRPDGPSTRTVADPRPSPPLPPTSAPPSVVPPSGAATPYGVFSPEQVVYGNEKANAQVEVPGGADWQVQTADVYVYYTDQDGEATQGVYGPALFKANYCEDATSQSARGFVGFTKSAVGLTAAQSNAQLAPQWVKAIALDTDTGEERPATPLQTSELTLKSGQSAVRADSTITTVAEKPCLATKVHFTMLSLDTGKYVANLVLVRDVDEDGVLDDATAEKILSSLQVQIDPGEG